MAYNYLKKKSTSSGGGSTGSNGAGPKQRERVFVRQAPDETVHTAPGAMYVIGGIGTFSGFAANIWQMVTTFTAFWFIFNPIGTPIDAQRQPVIFCICALIAFSFQFALTMLTWRLDTTWKKHNMRVAAGGSSGGPCVDLGCARLCGGHDRGLYLHSILHDAPGPWNAGIRDFHLRRGFVCPFHYRFCSLYRVHHRRVCSSSQPDASR